MWERCLPAMEVDADIRPIASSFIAGKPRSHRGRGASGRPRHRSSRASSAPTGIAGVSVGPRHRSSRASPTPAWLCSTNSLLTSNGASRSAGAPWVCSSVTHAVTAGLYVAGWLGCYVFLRGLRWKFRRVAPKPGRQVARLVFKGLKRCTGCK